MWRGNCLPFGEDFNGEGTRDTEIRYTGKPYNPALGLYDFGARYYDPNVGRFTSTDPIMGELENPQRLNSYAYGLNSPYKYVDPDGRDAVAVVFPDYRISTIIGKISNLGHAGILLINQNSGLTKYYQYGRYDKEEKGLVQNIQVPNVEIKNGEVDNNSLDKVLSVISEKAGHGGKIAGVYIKNNNFDKMNEFAEHWMNENSNPKRKTYSTLTRNCITFTRDVLESGGVDTPIMVMPKPNSYIDKLQRNFAPISYNPN